MTDGSGESYGTGLQELDSLIGGLQPGDNVVWQIDRLEQYATFCRPYCQNALASNTPVFYFRFARHEAIIEPTEGVQLIQLAPQAGFEAFIDAIHNVVDSQRRACYIFDCLSDLAADWFSDLMLGNFFVLTCPRILRAGHLAYFALLRNRHSNRATVPIRNTTQLFMDVYLHRDSVYLRPLKAKEREASGVAMVHRWTPGRFQDVTDSCTIADILAAATRSPLESALHPLDVWHQTFLLAKEYDRSPGPHDSAPPEELYEQLLRMLVSRDPRMLDLVRPWFTMADLQAIGRRTIGSGLIGGKTVGMLLARAILSRNSPRLNEVLETHDSFYVASDVFYTYLVHNGCWHIRRILNRRDLHPIPESDVARARMRTGSFPDEIMQQFGEMLDYFGQSPIIVRSSSLLEDDFGNSFAGKYDSVFCANQGSHQQRLDALIDAVRTIYASTLSDEALQYRARRGLLDRDEQMALLIQRVSGSRYGRYFVPQFAGVAYSFNPYAWSSYIDPKAGVVRLVFGLGTRAVDRTDDDYTRIAALNAPARVPDADDQGRPRATQQKVDVIDLVNNENTTVPFQELAAVCADMPGPAVLRSRSPQSRIAGGPPPKAQLDLNPLLLRTEFAACMREAMAVLHEAYAHPVDVEFAVNFQTESDFKIHLLQCRPFHYRGDAPVVEFPEDIPHERLIMHGMGPIIGHSRAERIDTVIWIDAHAYRDMPIPDRYTLARALGTILRARTRDGATLLIGPGRWGTSTPSMGVPVSFAEINTVSVLVELILPQEHLMPDLSLGTHFFSEMVEAEMLYVAQKASEEGLKLSFEPLHPWRVSLDSYGEDVARFADVLHLAETSGQVRLIADAAEQRIVCYCDPTGAR